MSEFKLTIVTPDGIVFDDMAENVIVRTTAGYVGILKNHAPYTAPLMMGTARIKVGNDWKIAACMSGVVNTDGESVRIAASTFEWADEIDVSRAEHAKENAKKIIESSSDNKQIDKARIKLLRAMTRLDVANKK